MAEYFPLLDRAVSGLPDQTTEARRSIYDRARAALIGQLRSVQPPIGEEDIERENKALDEAIARIEARYAAPIEPRRIEPNAPATALPEAARPRPVLSEQPRQPLQPRPPVAPPCGRCASDRRAGRPAERHDSARRPAADPRSACRRGSLARHWRVPRSERDRSPRRGLRLCGPSCRSVPFPPRRQTLRCRSPTPCRTEEPGTWTRPRPCPPLGSCRSRTSRTRSSAPRSTRWRVTMPRRPGSRFAPGRAGHGLRHRDRFRLDASARAPSWRQRSS